MERFPIHLASVERQIRIIGILDGARRVGASPVNLTALHSVAYFVDALAPVWNLPIIDGIILKRTEPYYPSLQADIDRLVGQGVVDVHDVNYRQEPSGEWRLDATYSLYDPLAGPILESADQLPGIANMIAFVREVVYATSGLGIDDVEEATAVDATYANPLLSVGNLVEVDPEDAYNLSAGFALRFGELVRGPVPLKSAEMVNLYVRHLYSRMQVA